MDVYAFDKLDGSSIRAEWSRKAGFYKFGKRKALLDDITPHIASAEPLFQEKYSEDLTRIFRQQRWDRVVVFFEFYGPSSFAGWHEEEEHTVTIFDVCPYKKGILNPREFIRTFESVDTAPLLYHGKPNHDFEQSVRNGTLEGMTFEGVVCKARFKKRPLPLMFKIKNQAWFDALRTRCRDMVDDEVRANQLYERMM